MVNTVQDSITATLHGLNITLMLLYETVCSSVEGNVYLFCCLMDCFSGGTVYCVA